MSHQEPSTADRVAGWVLLIPLAAAIPVASYFGFFLAIASDACGTGPCNEPVITVGWVVAAAIPWIVGLIAFVLLVVRTVRGQPVWWVPLLALGVLVAGWLAGLVLVIVGTRVLLW